MTTEENKAVIRRFYEEVWNKGNVDVALEVFADDYIRHDLRPGKALPGGEGQRRIAAEFRAAFPNVHMGVDLMVAEDDLVVARWTTTGTNTGPWNGVAPTGKPIQYSGVNIFRLANGKVVEIWNHRDDLGVMQQTGAPIYAGAADTGQS
jgi:steroid delta-isomerase-like uncharacterized protein